PPRSAVIAVSSMRRVPVTTIIGSPSAVHGPPSPPRTPAAPDPDRPRAVPGPPHGWVLKPAPRRPPVPVPPDWAERWRSRATRSLASTSAGPAVVRRKSATPHFAEAVASPP